MANGILFTTAAEPMNDWRAIKITLAVNSQLLDQIDYLAKRDYTTRSTILRLALIEYVRRPDNMLSTTSDSVYAETLADHPYVDPSDLELLSVLKKMKQAGGTEL